MNYKHTFRGNVLGDDTSYVGEAERFAFDLTPYTWGRLMSMRQALLAGNRDYGLDLCSVTTLSSGATGDDETGRTSGADLARSSSRSAFASSGARPLTGIPSPGTLTTSDAIPSRVSMIPSESSTDRTREIVRARAELTALCSLYQPAPY